MQTGLIEPTSKSLLGRHRAKLNAYMERKALSITLVCPHCAGEDFVTPTRLHKNSILTCRTCTDISLYGELLEAAGKLLMSQIQEQLTLQKVG